MNLAICLLTRDKIELVKQSLPVLMEGAAARKFDLYIIDGSTTPANEDIIFTLGRPHAFMQGNVKGGADTAVCYALNFMLDHPALYTHVGLVESDVVLDADWLDDTLALFDRARADGLEAGNVSARSYEDRVLFQRDGFAVMHNIGFGTQVLTRKAASIFVANIRSGYTTENRRLFMQLAGLDIGRFWAFRAAEHWLVPDWGVERILAQHGLASLALTPARCHMVGQDPPLAQQGLTLTTKPLLLRKTPDSFARYRDNLDRIRQGDLKITAPLARHHQQGSYTIFTHHLFPMGARFDGDWSLKWAAGFGPFAWKAAEPGAQLTIPVYGGVHFIVGAADKAKVEVEDLASGYKVSPTIDNSSPQPVMQVMVPGNVTQREVRLTARDAGAIVYGISTSEPQIEMPGIVFHHSRLPSP